MMPSESLYYSRYPIVPGAMPEICSSRMPAPGCDCASTPLSLPRSYPFPELESAPFPPYPSTDNPTPRPCVQAFIVNRDIDTSHSSQLQRSRDIRCAETHEKTPNPADAPHHRNNSNHHHKAPKKTTIDPTSHPSPRNLQLDGKIRHCGLFGTYTESV